MARKIVAGTQRMPMIVVLGLVIFVPGVFFTVRAKPAGTAALTTPFWTMRVHGATSLVQSTAAKTLSRCT